MGKSRGDFKRRNPVTRAMIEHRRSEAHMDKRRRILDRVVAEELDNVDPDEYDTRIDPAGNVSIVHTGEKHE
jgi:hypothetical protein